MSKKYPLLISKGAKAIKVQFNESEPIYTYTPNDFLLGLLKDNRKDVEIIKYIVSNKKILKCLKSSFTINDIKKGRKIEMEHTTDPEVAEKIALDHLKEFPEYYDELDKMETKLKKKHSKGKNPYELIDFSDREQLSDMCFKTEDEAKAYIKKHNIKDFEIIPVDDGDVVEIPVESNPKKEDGKNRYHVSWFYGRGSQTGKQKASYYTYASSEDQALRFGLYQELKKYGFIYFNEKKIHSLDKAVAIVKKASSKKGEYYSVEIDNPTSDNNPKSKLVLCEQCEKNEAKTKFRSAKVCFQCEAKLEDEEREYRGTNLEDYEDEDDEDAIIPIELKYEDVKKGNPKKESMTVKKELTYRIKKEATEIHGEKVEKFYIYYQIPLTGTWMPSMARGFDTVAEAKEFIKANFR